MDRVRRPGRCLVEWPVLSRIERDIGSDRFARNREPSGDGVQQDLTSRTHPQTHTQATCRARTPDTPRDYNDPAAGNGPPLILVAAGAKLPVRTFAD